MCCTVVQSTVTAFRMSVCKTVVHSMLALLLDCWQPYIEVYIEQENKQEEEHTVK